jgi:hypothetical protein
VRDQKGELFGVTARISDANEVIGEGNALILHEPQRNVEFYEGVRFIDSLSLFSGEDLLKKVKDNSFVKTLKKRKEEC